MTISWRGSQAVRSSLRYPLTSWSSDFISGEGWMFYVRGTRVQLGKLGRRQRASFMAFPFRLGEHEGDPFSDHMQGQPSIRNPNGASQQPDAELPIPAKVTIPTITSLDRGSSCPPPLCNRIKSLVSGDGLLFLGGVSAVVLPPSCSQARAAVHRLTPAPPSRRSSEAGDQAAVAGRRQG